MAGLEIKYEVVQECIRTMQQLPALFPAVTRPPVSSAGQGVTEIEQLADLYASFYGALERLTEETTKYLDNMVTDFKERDKRRQTHGGLKSQGAKSMSELRQKAGLSEEARGKKYANSEHDHSRLGNRQ